MGLGSRILWWKRCAKRCGKTETCNARLVNQAAGAVLRATSLRAVKRGSWLSTELVRAKDNERCESAAVGVRSPLMQAST